jgi:uncharacterized membrane protein
MRKRASMLIWIVGALIILYGAGMMVVEAQQGMINKAQQGAYMFLLGWAVVLINKVIARYQRTPDW